jgi:hypothetical protein
MTDLAGDESKPRMLAWPWSETRIADVTRDG